MVKHTVQKDMIQELSIAILEYIKSGVIFPTNEIGQNKANYTQQLFDEWRILMIRNNSNANYRKTLQTNFWKTF